MVKKTGKAPLNYIQRIYFKGYHNDVSELWPCLQMQKPLEQLMFKSHSDQLLTDRKRLPTGLLSMKYAVFFV